MNKLATSVVSKPSADEISARKKIRATNMTPHSTASLTTKRRNADLSTALERVVKDWRAQPAMEQDRAKRTTGWQDNENAVNSLRRRLGIGVRNSGI